ncbi:MAG: MFS transporter [Pseudomonadota bacterium]
MAEPSQFSLLRERRFLPYFITQALTALNDNVLRYGLIFLVTQNQLAVGDMGPDVVATLSAAIFMLPYFLFSAFAGQLADKFDKSWLMLRIKILELGLMLAAWLAIASGSGWAVLMLVFLMGAQSTLFGPVKYSLLPQVLKPEELTGGNALVEGATYLSIILGMIIGGYAVSGPGDVSQAFGVALVVIAVLGCLSAAAIPRASAPDPTLRLALNPIPETVRVIRMAREPRSVFLSILGISWFWSFGLVAMSQLPIYASDILNIPNGSDILILLPVTFAVGIGIGALLCERLSGPMIELGLVPLGAVGLSLFAIDLYVAQPTPMTATLATFQDIAQRPEVWRILLDLTLLGLVGGIYSVPLYAMMQQRSEPRQRARVIAANNILNSVFMCVAALFATLLASLGASVPQVFLVFALLNIAVSIYLFVLLPEFVMRFLTWILIHTLYRIRTTDIDRIPESGPALLVCNHVSFADALIIGGSVRRPVRFVMYFKIFQIPVLSWIFRTAKAIPIAGRSEDPALLDAAYEKIDAELVAGNVVCIFPEGAITRDGEIAEFRAGVERILARRPVPVVPMALRGLWGSWLSRKGGGAGMKFPRRVRARVDLLASAAVAPETATASSLQGAVQALYDGDRAAEQTS